ncbi:hypothetical protein ORD21_18530 [Deinococcus sp. ZS9-10]|uniref:Secreted protein n=1 Tax=Deinococcus arenicola TaxID=2994950 RepID=A0ABU4DY24_9DEIO|nr:hypothetical protein [Deinococcus sp. ZS9-10]MDV6376594.1 hypothetical protein [Deinococcus sp. ZS9-10]
MLVFSLEALLASLMASCRAMFLFDNVIAPGRGHHVLVVDVSQAWDLPDRGSVTPELIRMNDLWDTMLT